MNKLFLTPKELDDLWDKCQENDPCQNTPFETIVIKAQVKKCMENWELLVPKGYKVLSETDYGLATGVRTFNYERK